MKFKRAKRNLVGSRYWDSECGRYRVVAYEEVFGVKLRPVLYAAWHIYRKRDLDGHYFTEKRLGRLRKTKREAMAACSHHDKGRAGSRSTS